MVLVDQDGVERWSRIEVWDPVQREALRSSSHPAVCGAQLTQRAPNARHDSTPVQQGHHKDQQLISAMQASEDWGFLRRNAEQQCKQQLDESNP